MDNWAPTIIALAFLALAMFLVRQMIMGVKKDAEMEAKELKERLDKDEDDYLTQEKHQLLCANAQLELKAHITKVLTQMKDEMFTELRSIKAAINNGGG